MILFRSTARTSCVRLLPGLILLSQLHFAAAQSYWGSTAEPTSSGFNLDRSWDNNSWFNSPVATRSWQLGAAGSNTEVGMIVRQILPDSAAARNGINIGDTIVCVAGAQVGRVGNQVFDVSEEINRRADASGRVTLLVHDSRSQQLRPIRLSLNQPQGGLSGALVIRGGGLPANSMVTVQLENVDRPYFEIRNGQTSFRPPAFNVGEIPFVLNYDPSYIASGDRYRLRAFVTSDGRTVYDTTQPPFVLTQGNPSRVQLVLTPVVYGGSGAVNLPSLPGGAENLPGYPSFDSITQRIVAMYERYLGRRPSTVELAAWQQLPDIEYRLGTMPLELMAAQEYFDRVGNNNGYWLRSVFTEMLGRGPTGLEQDQWMRRYAQVGYSRMEVLRQLKQVTGRA